jgi:hypothetical protein
MLLNGWRKYKVSYKEHRTFTDEIIIIAIKLIVSIVKPFESNLLRLFLVVSLFGKRLYFTTIRNGM